MAFFPNLDEIDNQILAILTEDARISFAELGRRVNLSRVAARERVQSLVERGVIEKFSVVVDPRKVGYHISALIELEVEPYSLATITEKIINEEPVFRVHEVSGSSKLHIHALFEDIDHLHRFMAANIYSLRGVVKVKCEILLRSLKVRYAGIKITG
ncbi:MAG TPA: Lrp/AsnC family transcriptional regulator [Firmicutes bacterium]|nr:Lrp/AsnC family transcriptional regulator [Bacillota bacterium]